MSGSAEDLHRNESFAPNNNADSHFMPVVFWTMHRPAVTLADAVKADLLHQVDDRPAVEWANGDREWFRYGLQHRADDKPAFHGSNGAKGWYERGRLHRDGKPACIHPNGMEAWYENGFCHREGSPAVTCFSDWCFYDRGRPHRGDDLPAQFAVRRDGDDQCTVFVEWMDSDLLWRNPSLGPACIEYSPATGAWTVSYFYKGLPHNDFGPAEISVKPDGSVFQHYFLRGEHWDPVATERPHGSQHLNGLPELKPILPLGRRQHLLEDVSAGTGALDYVGDGAELITPLRPEHQLRSTKAILELLSGQRVQPLKFE